MTCGSPKRYSQGLQKKYELKMKRLAINALFGMATGAMKLVNFYTINTEKVNFIAIDIFVAILCFV